MRFLVLVMVVLAGCKQNETERQNLETAPVSASKREQPAAEPEAAQPFDFETTRRSAERVLEELPEAFPTTFPLPKPWRLLSQTERTVGGVSGREINFDFYWEEGAEEVFRTLRESLRGEVELIGTESFSAVYGPNFLVHVDKPRAGDKHLLITVLRRERLAALPGWTGSCQEVSLSPSPDFATDLAKAKPMAPGQSYAIGDTVAHPTWGPGRVVAMDESTVTIAIPPDDPGSGPFVLTCAR